MLQPFTPASIQLDLWSGWFAAELTQYSAAFPKALAQVAE
jgi:hypothetical protein